MHKNSISVTDRNGDRRKVLGLLQPQNVEQKETTKKLQGAQPAKQTQQPLAESTALEAHRSTAPDQQLNAEPSGTRRRSKSPRRPDPIKVPQLPSHPTVKRLGDTDFPLAQGSQAETVAPAGFEAMIPRVPVFRTIAGTPQGYPTKEPTAEPLGNLQSEANRSSLSVSTFATMKSGAARILADNETEEGNMRMMHYLVPDEQAAKVLDEMDGIVDGKYNGCEIHIEGKGQYIPCCGTSGAAPPVKVAETVKQSYTDSGENTSNPDTDVSVLDEHDDISVDCVGMTGDLRSYLPSMQICKSCYGLVDSDKVVKAWNATWHDGCLNCKLCGMKVQLAEGVLDGNAPVHISCKQAVSPRQSLNDGCTKYLPITSARVPEATEEDRWWASSPVAKAPASVTTIPVRPKQPDGPTSLSATPFVPTGPFRQYTPFVHASSTRSRSPAVQDTDMAICDRSSLGLKSEVTPVPKDFRSRSPTPSGVSPMSSSCGISSADIYRPARLSLPRSRSRSSTPTSAREATSPFAQTWTIISQPTKARSRSHTPTAPGEHSRTSTKKRHSGAHSASVKDGKSVCSQAKKASSRSRSTGNVEASKDAKHQSAQPTHKKKSAKKHKKSAKKQKKRASSAHVRPSTHPPADTTFLTASFYGDSGLSETETSTCEESGMDAEMDSSVLEQSMGDPGSPLSSRHLSPLLRVRSSSSIQSWGSSSSLLQVPSFHAGGSSRGKTAVF